jgi:SanA protein
LTRKKKIFLISGIVLGSILLTITSMNIWVVASTNSRITSDLSKLPNSDVALVLGTSRYLGPGQENPFFSNRIDAAAQLYLSGKVRKLLVSGDNGTEQYNETEQMRRALIEKGVPEKDIVMDYAGFRTFDSVVRSKAVFGQSKIIIVSQHFHLQRSLFIANKHGIDAWGYEAADPPHDGMYKRVMFREVFARVSAVLDCYLLGTQPKYPGPKEEIQFGPSGTSPEAR